MAEIKISQLPSGSPLGTDLTPATDTTDTSSAPTGTTKKYVRSDELKYYLEAKGLFTYDATRVATTGALTATYTNGSSGVGAQLTNAGAQAALTIDGVALAVNDRVLVKNQSAEAQNGIYTVTNIGSGSTNWVMTRATDYDQAVEIIQGGLVACSLGTTNTGTIWQEIGAGPFTIGTTDIIFDQYSVAYYTNPNITYTGEFLGDLGFSLYNVSSVTNDEVVPNQLLAVLELTNQPNLLTINLGNIQVSQNFFGTCQSLTSLSAPSLKIINGSQGLTANQLTSLSLPVLATCNAGLTIQSSTLTSISLPLLDFVGSGMFLSLPSASSVSVPSLRIIYSSTDLILGPTTSLSFPALEVATGTFIIYPPNNIVNFSMNPGLLQMAEFFSITGAALNQASVDGILVSLAALDGTGGTTSYNNATVDLSGGTSSTPGATGLAAKAVLEGRGCTVTVN